MDRHDELARGQSEMGAAIFHIELAERHSPLALRTGDIDFGAEREQSGREIAGIGGMKPLALWSDVTNVAAMFEAIGVGVPPPLALVIVDAAGIEAQIAADRRHAAVAGAGD